MIILFKYSFALAAAMVVYLLFALLPDLLFGSQEILYEWHFESRRDLAINLVIHSLVIIALLVAIRVVSKITEALFRKRVSFILAIIFLTLSVILLTPSANVTAGLVCAYLILHALTLGKRS